MIGHLYQDMPVIMLPTSIGATDKRKR